ncbi:MAG: response regulator [Candidatus Hydrogenedentes bacterium]|nr:response regulator [Candidatus Hydrogenedentota bacterium]
MDEQADIDDLQARYAQDETGISGQFAAIDASTKHALFSGAISLMGLAVVVLAANQAYLNNHISQLTGDFLQYSAISLIGLVLIRTAVNVVGIGLVRNILVMAFICILMSSVLNVTNNVQALNTWPLLGIESSLNQPVKEVLEVLSIILALMALVVAILSLKHARDRLLQKQTQLLAEVAARKEAQAEQMRLERQNLQLQKMEALGQLTGGVAHDFNNLLQVISGYTDIAIGSLETGHPARDLLLEVAKAGERATSLVSQLLLFSRRQIMRPESLVLNDVIASFLKMLQRVIGEHIALRWRPGSGLGTILADRGMVEQTLMNLCVNARDAMPEGGILTIETRDTHVDEHFRAMHPEASSVRYAMFSVSDNGCGMESEILSQIFEPFFTTKETGKGTGLGLATVYGIIKQHDGMIFAYSEPGKGAEFQLYWPVVEPSVVANKPTLPPSSTRGTETILLVEDEDMVRELAKKILRNAGYTVLEARDGAEAVALFKEHANRIQMAILDVVMPGMGGHVAYRKMREMRPGFKTLFVSGYSADGIHTDFVLDKNLNLIQKPFNRETLLHAVRRVLDQVEQ